MFLHRYYIADGLCLFNCYHYDNTNFQSFLEDPVRPLASS